MARGVMPELDPQNLPLVQRLALSYAPLSSRAQTLALLAFDNRLAAILRQGGEPVIAQIKLAWWRDRLRENPDIWPAGEPLLHALQHWPGGPGVLIPLVDGWEGLLAAELSAQEIDEFAKGRAAAWAALAPPENAPAVISAARGWALADLAFNLGQAEEAATVRELARSETRDGGRLPRRLRSLAVLHGLARRALRRESAELLDGPGAGFVALRIGLFGR